MLNLQDLTEDLPPVILVRLARSFPVWLLLAVLAHLACLALLFVCGPGAKGQGPGRDFDRNVNHTYLLTYEKLFTMGRQ